MYKVINFAIFLVIGLVAGNLYAQCPPGNYFAENQAHIDNFKILYPNCTKISGDLTVQNSTNITNVNGFNNIDTITNDLNLVTNSNLTNLDGFKKLKFVGNNLWITGNSTLISIISFDNLVSAGIYIRVGSNAILSNVSGFEKVQKFDILDIRDNPELTTFACFDSVTTKPYVEFLNNSKLTDIQSIGKIDSITNINIENNAALTNLTALKSVKFIGEINIRTNPSLINLNDLSTVANVNGKIEINNNATLNDISGLININPVTIGGSGLIITNNNLLSVCNLPNFCTYLQGAGARNISGNLGNCLTEQAVINACILAPAAPVATAATNINGPNFTANWLSVANATNYFIDVSDSPTFSTLMPGYNNRDVGNVLSFNVTGLPNAPVYYYRVRASNGSGVSASSNTINVSTVSSTPLVLSGFNHDIIAEGVGGVNRAAATTSITFDSIFMAGGYVFYSKDFRGNNNQNSAPPLGLPVNRIINSVDNPGVSYQLAPYNMKNALVLRNLGSSGTLTLETPGIFSSFSMLGTCAGGPCDLNVIYNFSDGTNFTKVLNIADWDSGTGPVAIKGMGVVSRTQIINLPPDSFDGNSDIPKLYDNFVIIDAPFTSKILTSITFQKLTETGSTGIFAINGITAPGAPAAPVATAATNINGPNFTANWLSVANATNYFIDVSDSPTFSTLIPGYNNRDVGNVLSFNVTGLPTAPVYYYRVRASNISGVSLSSNTIAFITFNLVPLALSGFNHDIIAEGAGGLNRAEATTTITFDSPITLGNVFYSTDFRGNNNQNAAPPFGLPANRIINSITIPEVSYQLAPYDTNNALVLKVNSPRTLTLETPGVFSFISILGASAGGNTFNDVIFNFSDGTNYTSFFTVPDYVSGTGQIAIKGMGVVTRTAIGTNAPDSFDGNSDIPKLYDNFVIIDAPFTSKILTSITFRKESETGSTGIFAIIGITAPGAPAAPVATAATNINGTNFTANWLSVANATNYFIDVSDSPTFSTLMPGYNNRDVGNVLSFNVTGLPNPPSYFYRVRASNILGVGPSSNTIDAIIPLCPIPPTMEIRISGCGEVDGNYTLESVSCQQVFGYINYEYSHQLANGDQIRLGGFNNFPEYLENNYLRYYDASAGSNAINDISNRICRSDQKMVWPSDFLSDFSPCSRTGTCKVAVVSTPISDDCKEWIEMVNLNFLVSSTACADDSIHFIDYSNVEIEEDAFFSWDFGDGNTSNDRDPIYTYPQAGEYTVSLQISNTACVGINLVKNIDILGCSKVAIPDLGFTSVYPTPNNGDFIIDINLPESSPIIIKIFNSDGKVVQEYSYKDKDTLTDHFTLDNTGMYYIVVIHKFGSEARRTIVIK